MKNEIQEILKIVKSEKELNSNRHHELQSSLGNEIQQVLKIVKSEQELNSDRYRELKEVLKSDQKLNSNRYHELKASIKTEIQQVLKIVTSEQELNTHRYHELKSSVDDITSKMATKDHLDQVYESLSQDITYLSGDHHKLKRRVEIVEKKVKKLEGRAS